MGIPKFGLLLLVMPLLTRAEQLADANYVAGAYEYSGYNLPQYTPPQFVHPIPFPPYDQYSPQYDQYSPPFVQPNNEPTDFADPHHGYDHSFNGNHYDPPNGNGAEFEEKNGHENGHENGQTHEDDRTNTHKNGHDQFTNGHDQFTNGHDQFTNGHEHFTNGHDQYPTNGFDHYEPQNGYSRYNSPDANPINGYDQFDSHDRGHYDQQDPYDSQRNIYDRPPEYDAPTAYVPPINYDQPPPFDQQAYPNPNEFPQVAPLPPYPILHKTDKSQDEIRAAQYLDTLRFTVPSLVTGMSEFMWNSEGIPTHMALGTMQSFIDGIKAIWTDLKDIDYEHFQNGDLKRQMKLIMDMKTLALDTNEFYSLLIEYSKLAHLDTTIEVCEFNNALNCHLKYVPDISSAKVATKDGDELLHYWASWRNEATEQVKLSLPKLVAHLHDAATIQNFLNTSSMYYNDYENADFFTELGDAFREIQDFYKELHGHLRFLLQRIHGGHDTNPNGNIPDHLIEQLLAQLWSWEGIEYPFPDKPLPNVTQTLTEQWYDSEQMLKKSEHFYTNIGFEPLNSQFWTFERTRPSVNYGDGCVGKVEKKLYDVPGYKYCPSIDFKTLIEMHSDLAEVFYEKHTADLAFAYQRPPSPGFAHAIGGALALSVSTPNYLQDNGLLTDFYDDKQTNLNRLYLLALHTMLPLARNMAFEKFWVEVMDEKVNVDSGNCIFWGHMSRFAGIEPPEVRTSSHVDLPPTFYKHIYSDQNTFTYYIFSEIVKYQIYRALCLRNGQYVRGDPDRPLHLCSLHNDQEAGKIIKTVMRLGASLDWRENLRVLTGENYLSGSAILEFFDPLKVWITEENRKHHVQAGWKNSTKCTEQSAYWGLFEN